MVSLAYDGTTHGDWIAQYAIRWAVAEGATVLRLLHVTDPSAAHWSERLAALESECRRVGLALDVHLLGAGASVARVLLNATSPEPTTFLVCGTRATQRGSGILVGSVGSELLASADRNVLALHIAHPGLLGAPADLLIPLMGHPRALTSTLGWLRLLAPLLRRAHLLLVVPPRRWWPKPLAASQVEEATGVGREYLERCVEQWNQLTWARHVAIDASVHISRNVAQEIIHQSIRTRSELILLGASQRTWSQRLWSGPPIEHVLRHSPCDVAIYRGVP